MRTNRNGLTFNQWMSATGRYGTRLNTLVEAWTQGSDPADWHVSLVWKCDECGERNIPKEASHCPNCSGLNPELFARFAGRVATDETSTCYAVFRRATVEKFFGPITADNVDSIARGLTGWGRHYGGPGQSFSSEPTVRITRTALVVKQHRGLDI